MFSSFFLRTSETSDSTTLSGWHSTTCLFSLWATSSIISVSTSVLQESNKQVVYLFSPVERRRRYKLTASFSFSASGRNTRTSPLEFFTSQCCLPLLYIVLCICVGELLASVSSSHILALLSKSREELASNQALDCTELECRRIVFWFYGVFIPVNFGKVSHRWKSIS